MRIGRQHVGCEQLGCIWGCQERIVYWRIGCAAHQPPFSSAKWFRLLHFMKTSIVAAVLFSVFNIHAQNAGLAPVAGQANGSAPAQDTPYAIVQNGANSRVWERTTYEQLPSGEFVPHIHRYE